VEVGLALRLQGVCWRTGRERGVFCVCVCVRVIVAGVCVCVGVSVAAGVTLLLMCWFLTPASVLGIVLAF
jgi:hypothetical protein